MPVENPGCFPHQVNLRTHGPGALFIQEYFRPVGGGEYLERRTEDGKAGVVRNGYLPARELRTSLGLVTI